MMLLWNVANVQASSTLTNVFSLAFAIYATLRSYWSFLCSSMESDITLKILFRESGQWLRWTRPTHFTSNLSNSFVNGISHKFYSSEEVPFLCFMLSVNFRTHNAGYTSFKFPRDLFVKFITVCVRVLSLGLCYAINLWISRSDYSLVLILQRLFDRRTTDIFLSSSRLFLRYSSSFSA